MKLNYKNFEIELSYNICKESNSNNDLIQYRKYIFQIQTRKTQLNMSLLLKNPESKFQMPKFTG